MNINDDFLNKIYYKSSERMEEVPSQSVNLIVTPPPYFSIKDYSKDGYQKNHHSDKTKGQLGDLTNYKIFIGSLLKVWMECERVLKPNGKLAINTPLIPMKKNSYNSHYNRHIFDLNADIQHSILYREDTKMFLMDTYIWERSNGTKNLMFGSYPYPKNFYAQNYCEFITIYVKDGLPANNVDKEIKERSKLTEKEWVEYTSQVWRIPIPNKSDVAFGKHSAIMPEEIVKRCVRLFTFEGDIVLDPFAGSGSTLKVAEDLNRNYVGYEIMPEYEVIIQKKLNSRQMSFFQ